MNTEVSVTFIRMMKNFIVTWSNTRIQETVLDKLSNIEKKLIILTFKYVDYIKNLVPISWKTDTNYDLGMIVSYEWKNL